jgi:hypothetical protein
MNFASAMAFALLFITFNLYASENLNLNRAKLNNLNLNFEKSNGHISFDELSWQTNLHSAQIKENALSFNYEEANKKLSLNHDLFNGQYMLSSFKLPSVMSFLDIESLNLNFQEGRELSIELQNLKAHIGNDVQQLQQIQLSCAQTNGAFDLSTLSQCLSNMGLNVQQITLAASSSETYYALFPDSIAGKKNFLTPKTFNDIELNTLNNAFSLSFTTKLLVKFKIQIVVNLNLVVNKNSGLQLKIAISRAKVSIFNIKSLLLFAIKKANIKNVTVEGDQVLITL